MVRRSNLRSSFASAMVLALIVPVLAACGGGTGGESTAATSAPATTNTTSAPAATTGGAAEATAAPAATTGSAATAAPAATAAGAAATAAPSGATGGSTAGAQPGVFRYNLGGEPSTADPQTMSFSDEITFGLMNYQPLMTFDKDLKPAPGQAESFTTSEDGKVYTFKLRADSKYSDGSPLTAANFEYAWKRLADPELAGEYQFIGCGLIEGYSEYAATTCTDASGNTKTITEVADLDLDALRNGVGVKAIDDTTLEVRLVQATPYFPSIAAMWVGAPVREQDAEQGEDWWYEPANYIGNGPYILKEWNHEQNAVWERNPNWALGQAGFERVEMRMITEAQVAFEAYKNGELDYVAIGREDLQAVEADPELKSQVLNQSPRYSFYVGFNLRKAPFDNVKVRQAFSQALDREAYVRDVLGGLGRPAYTFIPPGIPGHLEGEQPYKFDAAAAKQLLGEAGFPNGQGFPEVKLTYGQSARNQTRFEWMANQLRQSLGINVTLDPVDPNAYSELTKSPETIPQMFFLGWGPDFPDPQNYYSTVFKTGTSSASETGFSNKEFDALTEQADREADQAKRLELYKQASDLMIADAPVAFLYYDQNRVLIKPYVKGITADTITPLDFIPGAYNLTNVSIAP